ncbi:MAG: TetR family transcriptional regulator [Pseudomonadota bacterium]
MTARTRTAIIEAAIAVFAANPGASLGDVAKAAQVGRATLHRHFSSRDALLREVSLEAIRACDEAVEHLDVDALRGHELLQAVLEAVIPLGDRYYYLSMVGLEGDPEVTAAYAAQTERLHTLVVRLKDDGVFDPLVPDRWISTAFDALIWAGWHAVGTGDVARNDAASQVARTLTQGLAPAK